MTMIKNPISSTCFFLLFLPLLASCTDKQEIYLVQFGEKTSSEDKTLHEIENTHHSYLLSVKQTEEEARTSLLYSYKHSINGFAALLTPNEANLLSDMEEVASVHKNQQRIYSLHTTRSWKFVGLDESETLNPWTQDSNQTNGDLLSRAKYGEDIIVGMIDSGVWPDSKSFRDEGMGPVPQKWKGVCENGTAFTSSQCNRKIIGARYYLNGYESIFGPLNEEEDYKSARDKDGHGTHTASIIAGRVVPKASALGGFASGTASGGAPLARLAIYKACWPIKGQSKDEGNTCMEVDMLKAIDDAIGDGVDVLSISIGFNKPLPYEDDVIAIGALHAVRKNIVVVCSAGNSGPSPKTLSNPAPWIITVGASTVDRSFFTPIKLRNGRTIEGHSITPVPVHEEKIFYPLVLASDVEQQGVLRTNSGYCLDNTLEPNKVQGKIVLCMRGQGQRLKKGLEVQRAGGVGFILGNNEKYGNDVPYDPHFIPATGVSYENALKIIQYIQSSPNPMAHFLPGKTVLKAKPAPSMASFSSRGPNIIDPYILKPDITAPGVYILAAWTEEDGPTRMTFHDKRVVKFNIFSGTSMSCPHVSAAAVLLKAIHPTWSSAAIRSALITTAVTTDNTGNPMTDETKNPANPFAMGSGHFNPKKAADPGLVYDASYMDYFIYTCHLGIAQNLTITDKCPNSLHEPFDLNYPSIQVHKLNVTRTIRRSVTNVGKRRIVYKFIANSPKEYKITATPNILRFNHVGQKINFTITVTARRGHITNKTDPYQYYFGWYAWTHKHYIVKSQVAVSFDSFP
ncbi:PREDICTED: subtilisin-like protease SBT5.6 [Lupinus angustifolius]|uniref:subtilisin-like protease SBT5.6 n=1 Tax=Lupinus angustifolius TaxID=3871 RepID=UPI00092FA296|nr:PREDICTED: subtilisin-like protease SBT5.6 [Lupinus angustifolius]